MAMTTHIFLKIFLSLCYILPKSVRDLWSCDIKLKEPKLLSKNVRLKWKVIQL